MTSSHKYSTTNNSFTQNQSCNSKYKVQNKIIPAFKISLNSFFAQTEHLRKNLLNQTKVANKSLVVKRLGDSSQDRLVQLNISQIDRLIDMQKIKQLLNDRKQKQGQKYFQFVPQNQNKHHNVYQARFLTKVNSEAIRRNIKGQKSEGLISHQTIKVKEQKNNQQFKYVKKYMQNLVKRKKSQPQDLIQRQISTIRADYEKFDIQLKNKNKNMLKNGKNKQMVRWFRGMSKQFIQQQQKKRQKYKIEKSIFDIQSQIKNENKQTQNNIKIEKHKSNKFRTKRVITLCM